MNIPANDPTLRSWIDVPAGSDFPIQNIPFGIAGTGERSARPFTRIGDTAIDLSVLADAGLLNGIDIDLACFKAPVLNPLLRHGRQGTRRLRQRLSDLLSAVNPELRDNSALRAKALLPVASITMHLPVNIGDYTDFYSSRQHAYNVGCMFRDPANALLPNWLHMPVGYHGRASSIVVSGTPIRRPMGQYKPSPDAAPEFGPSRQLDLELEVAFITYEGNALGDRIPTAEAEDRIFGLVLFNDWSARDIQAWEYVPLGPFLGKNFGSSMSAWVVTLDALEPFRIASPKQEPEVLPYLKGAPDMHFDIALEVALQPKGTAETVISRSNFKHMYWSMAQQLAHHTVNGCNVRAGDVMASGTISGDTPDSYGSMLELAWKGTKPVKLNDGSERKFLQDGDTLIIRGHCEKSGVRIGFGEVSGEILPAK
jgi:fumarylacetoacetase